MKNKLIKLLSLIAMSLCFVIVAVAQTTTDAPANTGFFSAENIVSVIISGLISVGATQWLKNRSGLAGAGAAFLTLFVVFIVGLVAFLASSFISGSFSWEHVALGAGQIFTLATLAYRLIPVQSE